MFHLKVFRDDKEVLSLAALSHKIFFDRLPNIASTFRFVNIRGLILNISWDDLRPMLHKTYAPCMVLFFENETVLFEDQCDMTILQPISPSRWQLGQSIIFKARLFQPAVVIN